MGKGMSGQELSPVARAFKKGGGDEEGRRVREGMYHQFQGDLGMGEGSSNGEGTISEAREGVSITGVG